MTAIALYIMAGLSTFACAGPAAQNTVSGSTKPASEKSVTVDTQRPQQDPQADQSASRTNAQDVDQGADDATPPDLVAMPADKRGRKGSKAREQSKQKKKDSKRDKSDKRKRSKSEPGATPEQRRALSAYLLPLARKAAKERSTRGKAISLYRGLVAARGAGDDVALELARVYRLAEDFNAAAEVYLAFAKATANSKAAAEARKEAKAVAEQPAPFDKPFRVEPALKEARAAWNSGRKASRRKQWDKALVYYKMAAGLAPDMPGPVRELGTVYKKLGRSDVARDYFHDYLRRRPVGKIADEVRKALLKSKDPTLGRVTVVGTKKLPCEEVWVMEQLATRRLPIKRLALPAGRYKWLCFNGKFGMAFYKWVTVPTGGDVTINFTWALVENGLTKPFGRVRVEHYQNTNVMMDLGLAQNLVGVPVPDDGRALKVKLISDDRTRIEDRLVKLTPGERTVIKW